MRPCKSDMENSKGKSAKPALIAFDVDIGEGNISNATFGLSVTLPPRILDKRTVRVKNGRIKYESRHFQHRQAV